MLTAMKPGYINPLTMMNRKSNSHSLHLPAQNTDRAADQVKSLTMKQQNVKNETLLLKVTSSNGEVPEETQDMLDNNLEQVTAELNAAKAKELLSSQKVNANEQLRSLENTAAMSKQPLFDRFEKQADVNKGSLSEIYQMHKDEHGIPRWGVKAMG